jgi:proteasome lid subunit RPN8/RPN11
MGTMTKAGLPKSMLQSIFKQAEQEYPHECCGMILGPRGKKGDLSRLRPCRNAQNEYHALDPENFSRDSRTAYFIDPKELLAVQKETRERNEEIRMIYHSHIDAGSYFSEEDMRIALAEGEPAYPGARYLVVSVVEGKAKDFQIYSWDPGRRMFLS